jgi:hypothetical protein
MVRVMRGAAVVLVLGFWLSACADPVPPSATSAPDALEVRCDGTTTDVLTPTVQAQRDGVHVLIHNTTTGEDLSVTWEGGGDGAAPGDTTLVFPIQPGRSRIRCLPNSEDAAIENGDRGGFDVLAPDGWVSPDLACSGTAYGGVGDYGPDARGVADPSADAEKRFRLDGTVIEAGYQNENQRIFIDRVGGEPKESLTYIADGHGGWLLSETAGCSD